MNVMKIKENKEKKQEDANKPNRLQVKVSKKSVNHPHTGKRQSSAFFLIT